MPIYDMEKSRGLMDQWLAAKDAEAKATTAAADYGRTNPGDAAGFMLLMETSMAAHARSKELYAQLQAFRLDTD